jgi:dihydropyrimidinase
MHFTNWPRYTILRGKVMWKEGQLLGTAANGQYLKRGKSLLGAPTPGPAKDVHRVATWLKD